MEVSDVRASVTARGRRYTPGVYAVDEATAKEVEGTPHVYCRYVDGSPAGEDKRYAEDPGAVGPMTRADLNVGLSLSACDACGRTYKTQHICPGPDGQDDDSGGEDAPSDEVSAASTEDPLNYAVGAGEAEVVFHELSPDDVVAGLDEPASHCPCPDGCACMACPSCVAHTGLGEG